MARSFFSMLIFCGLALGASEPREASHAELAAPSTSCTWQWLEQAGQCDPRRQDEARCWTFCDLWR